MGEGVFSSGNWGLVVPGSSSGFLTALVILMESCTVEGSLLQLVLLLWPKIDRVPCRGQHPSEGWALALGGGGASLIRPSLNPIDTPVTGLGISSVANSEGK